MQEKLKYKVPSGILPTRLDVYLSDAMGETRSRVQKMIRKTGVEVSLKKVFKPSMLLQGEEELECHLNTEPSQQSTIPPSNIEVDLLVDCAPDWVVINKAQGIVVHPGAANTTGTLAQTMVQLYPELMQEFSDRYRPGVVHRLDKETSGVLIWALNRDSHEMLARQFRSRTVNKIYLAWLHGELRQYLEIKSPIRRSTKDPKRFTSKSRGGRAPEGRDAHTRIWPISIRDADETFPNGRTLAVIQILTGRTHQIRVHCSDSERAVVGDPVYETSSSTNMNMMLHAWEISFHDPHSNKKMTVRAPIPICFKLKSAEVSHLENWYKTVSPGMDQTIAGIEG